MQAKILKKLTVAGIGYDADRLENIVTAAEGETVVMRVVGNVERIETKSTDIGPYTVFCGSFSATDPASDSKFRAGKLILPSIAEEILGPQVAELKAVDPSGRVKFAFDISVERSNSKKGGRKYKYGVRSLLEPAEDDELSKLEASLPKMLAAPKEPDKKKGVFGR